MSAAERATILSPAAAEVLAQVTATETTVALPAMLLDRKVYQEVDRALSRIGGGGKWNRGQRAHLFTRDPRPELDHIAATGQMPADQDKVLSFWRTPDWLAARLVSEAGIHSLPAQPARAWVLEPSAGDGAIARAVASVAPAAHLQCIEVDGNRCASLVEQRFQVANMRFQDWVDSRPVIELSFDAIVMNPPFTEPGDRMAWATHLTLAFGLLGMGSRLAAIVPRSVEHGQSKRAEEVRRLIDRHGRLERLPDDAFAESGTQVATNLVVLTANGGAK